MYEPLSEVFSIIILFTGSFVCFLLQVFGVCSCKLVMLSLDPLDSRPPHRLKPLVCCEKPLNSSFRGEYPKKVSFQTASRNEQMKITFQNIDLLPRLGHASSTTRPKRSVKSCLFAFSKCY